MHWVFLEGEVPKKPFQFETFFFGPVIKKQSLIFL